MELCLFLDSNNKDLNYDNTFHCWGAWGNCGPSYLMPEVGSLKSSYCEKPKLHTETLCHFKEEDQCKTHKLTLPRPKLIPEVIEQHILSLVPNFNP